MTDQQIIEKAKAQMDSIPFVSRGYRHTALVEFDDKGVHKIATVLFEQTLWCRTTPGQKDEWFYKWQYISNNINS